VGLGDWKAKLTSEPSRLGEDYASGDLEWVGNKILIKSDHQKTLESINIRPWNKIRQQAALLILKSRIQLIHQRKQRLEEYRKLIKNLPLELPAMGMPVRLPILLSVDDKPTMEKLADRGIKKQYPPSWPMANLDLPNSKKFYYQAFTLPLHQSVTEGDIEKNSDLIRTYLPK
jgi:dTDP-4-amino-4,6-dideoxygalactose transaminase